MTFRKKSVNTASNECGIVISCLERFSMEYKEHEHIMTIGVESMFNPPGVAVALSLKKNWDSPHEAEKIDDNQWVEIRENITEGFKALNLVVEFE